MNLRGVLGRAFPSKCQRVQVRVRGLDDSLMIGHALTVPLNLPAQSIPAENVRLIYDKPGIEIGRLDKARPQVLIDQDNPHLIQGQETWNIKGTGLSLKRSLLGHSVHGLEDGSAGSPLTACVNAEVAACESEHVKTVSFAELDNLVREFITTENLGVDSAEPCQQMRQGSWKARL